MIAPLGPRPPLPEDWGTPTDAESLRQWRALRRINQRDLGDILGVHYVTIARWETGERPVPPFLHLALESIDRRLSFLERPPARPPRPARPKQRPGTTSIGVSL